MPSHGGTRSVRRALERLRALGSALALASCLAASSAHASPETLRVAFEDMVMGAADVAVSPVTGGIAAWENRSSVSGNGFLQALYLVPTVIGLTGLQAVKGGLRAVTGLVEFFPGVALFPAEKDLDPDFNIFRRGDLLLDVANPLAESPPWLVYVPLLTPFAMDVRLGPTSAWSSYSAEGLEPFSSPREAGAAVSR